MIRRQTTKSGKHSCSHKGKRRFRDHKQAVTALQNVRTRGVQREKMPVRVYQCHTCRGWYLTSQETP